MKDTKTINTQPRDVTPIPQTSTNPKGLSIQEQYERDSRMVRGIFKYYEVPNGVLRFSYKAYPQEQVKNYELFDGQIYSIPYGVAKHLNKNCWYPQMEYTFDKHGLPVQSLQRKIRRTSFQSLEFMPDEDEMHDTNILTVKQIQAMAI